MDKNILYMLVGTYTSGSSAGIYVYRFNMETGTAEQVGEAKTSNPSYLAVSQDERFVYSVGENSLKDAAAGAFSFDRQTGLLTMLNRQPTNSADPCYINTDRNGKFVATANYSGGTISVFPLCADGTLQPVAKLFEFDGSGPDSKRQEKPHLHCTVFSPDGKYLFGCDLGTDRIHKFEVTEEPPFLKTGTPDAFQLEPGSGPRHLTFHPNGKYAYVINELSGKVAAFQYADGNLKAIQYIASDSTPGVGGKGSADIHIAPGGKFLYASNRLKADGIAIFRIDETNGQLTRVGYQPTGIHPRNFIISPNGKYLLVANKDSNNIQIFEINPQTGLLTDTGKEITGIDKPVCLKFIDY
jgi:6-phosphogluconolactonase (cycloisomerase 2 family)